MFCQKHCKGGIKIAINFVKFCKEELQKMRDEGWDSLLKDVTNFCEQHEILVPNMNDNFFVNGKSRRMTPHVTMWHHYHANLFVSVIDMLLQELNNRFNETNLELLHSIACFSPLDSFHAFDLDK